MDRFAAAGLTVVANPIPAVNPNHADAIGWPAEKPAQKIIALEIALHATFRPAAPDTPDGESNGS